MKLTTVDKFFQFLENKEGRTSPNAQKLLKLLKDPDPFPGFERIDRYRFRRVRKNLQKEDMPESIRNVLPILENITKIVSIKSETLHKIAIGSKEGYETSHVFVVELPETTLIIENNSIRNERNTVIYIPVDSGGKNLFEIQLAFLIGRSDYLEKIGYSVEGSLEGQVVLSKKQEVGVEGSIENLLGFNKEEKLLLKKIGFTEGISTTLYRLRRAFNSIQVQRDRTAKLKHPLLSEKLNLSEKPRYAVRGGTATLVIEDVQIPLDRLKANLTPREFLVMILPERVDLLPEGYVKHRGISPGSVLYWNNNIDVSEPVRAGDILEYLIEDFGFNVQGIKKFISSEKGYVNPPGAVFLLEDSSGNKLKYFSLSYKRALYVNGKKYQGPLYKPPVDKYFAPLLKGYVPSKEPTREKSIPASQIVRDPSSPEVSFTYGRISRSGKGKEGTWSEIAPHLTDTTYDNIENVGKKLGIKWEKAYIYNLKNEAMVAVFGKDKKGREFMFDKYGAGQAGQTELRLGTKKIQVSKVLARKDSPFEEN